PFTVAAAAATHLSVTNPPASPTAGSPSPVRLTAHDQDAYVSPSSNDRRDVTVTLGSGTRPLQRKTTIAASSGIATFAGLRNDVPGSKTLPFADGALPATAATPFTVAAAAATHLSVTNAPASLTAGAPAPVRVTALDQFDNVST